MRILGTHETLFICRRCFNLYLYFFLLFLSFVTEANDTCLIKADIFLNGNLVLIHYTDFNWFLFLYINILTNTTDFQWMHKKVLNIIFRRIFVSTLQKESGHPRTVIQMCICGWRCPLDFVFVVTFLLVGCHLKAFFKWRHSSWH